MQNFRRIFWIALIGLLAIALYSFYQKYVHENAILRQMIDRLQADSRVAEVLVTGVNFDEASKTRRTTIKFLEYNSKGQPLEPKYFTFSGNIIQFQSLVIRFDDIHVRRADRLKGKSAHVFWRVFMLDGKKTEQFEISPVYEVPDGYRVAKDDPYEAYLWKNFWEYALDPRKGKELGIKNAQIEAPGMMFVPGILYTIKIEHDGGLRVDTAQLSPILKGEKIP